MSANKNLTIWDIIDIWETYEKLSNNGQRKVTKAEVTDTLNKYSAHTVGRVITIFESRKFGYVITSEVHRNCLNVADLYFMSSKAPEYLKAWRTMELLENPYSVISAAKCLASRPDAVYTETTYKNIHKVFSSIREGKLDTGVNNETLNKVAIAYFKIVKVHTKNKNYVSKKNYTRNYNIDYAAIYEDYYTSNSSRQEVAKRNSCPRSTFDTIIRIFNARKNNLPIAEYDKQRTNIINAADAYFNNASTNATNTISNSDVNMNNVVNTNSISMDDYTRLTTAYRKAYEDAITAAESRRIADELMLEYILRSELNK